MAVQDGYLQTFQNYGIYSNNNLYSEKITSSRQQSVLFKYSWTLQLPDGEENLPRVMKLPEFPTRAHSGITWYLTMYCKNRVLKRGNFSTSVCGCLNFVDSIETSISCKLSLATSNVQNVTADYRFTLLNSQGSIIENSTKAANKSFKLNIPLNTSDVIKLYSFKNICLKRRHIECKLTIECEITVPVSEVYPAQHQNVSENEQNSDFQFTEILLTMFENEEFCDVTFSVNGKEFKAHKVILAAGSSVFKVMFEHDMMEKKHNRVEITDIDIEVLRELVRFIYTKKVSNLKKIAKELLVAADKYDLEKLRNKCESELSNNVSTENVAEMFIFADTYNAVFLKTKAKDYIVGYSKDVSDTAGWKSMVMTHPHLIAEAFIALSNK